MTAVDWLTLGAGAAGWVLAATLGLKLRGKAPPKGDGLGKRGP